MPTPETTEHVMLKNRGRLPSSPPPSSGPDPSVSLYLYPPVMWVLYASLVRPFLCPLYREDRGPSCVWVGF